MKINKRKVCICLLISSLFIVWLFFVISINQKYAAPSYRQHMLGEHFEFNGFEICATDIRFMDRNSVNRLFADVIPYWGDCKCVLYFLTITNNTSAPKEIELQYFVMQTSAWCNSILMHTYGEISQMYYPELPITLHPTLEPGETIQCVLPYTMPKVQFTEKQWAACESAGYELMVSLYPIKEYITLQ